MRYFIICLLFILSIHVKGQEADCYTIVLKGASICNSTQKWSVMKVTASKERLLKFLRTNNKVLHPCEYMLKPEASILKEFKNANCSPEVIKIEFDEPKDVLQLYKELKENKQRESKTEQDKHEGNKQVESKVNGSQLLSSVEMCLNSDGEVSLSFSNEIGSFQVTSKGKFSVSVKGNNDTEYKVGL